MLSMALLLAAAAPPVPLIPTGPWVVRAEENMCLLERAYPVGKDVVSLVFQPLLDLDSMELYVITPDRSDQQYQGDYQVRIAAGAEPYSGRYFSVFGAKVKNRITRLTVNRAALDELKDGYTLQVQAKPVNLAFRIARPDKARVALKNCVTDLKKSWGIDDATADRAVTMIDGNPGRYFSSDSYPPEALRQGIYGRVIALLNIDVKGAVEHCRIVSSAGSALNDGTCRAAMRIRFKPPVDKDGQPLPSTYLLPVRWALPGQPS